MKGSTMIEVLILGAFTVLVIAAFWVANSERSKAAEANDRAKTAMAHIEAVDNSIVELRDQMAEMKKTMDFSNVQFKNMIDVVLKSDAHGEELRKKIEWLEMKARNEPRKLEKLVISQEKPLDINVLYRPMVKIKPLTDAQIRSKLMKNMTKKIQELSN